MNPRVFALGALVGSAATALAALAAWPQPAPTELPTPAVAAVAPPSEPLAPDPRSCADLERKLHHTQLQLDYANGALLRLRRDEEGDVMPWPDTPVREHATPEAFANGLEALQQCFPTWSQPIVDCSEAPCVAVFNTGDESGDFPIIEVRNCAEWEKYWGLDQMQTGWNDCGDQPSQQALGFFVHARHILPDQGEQAQDKMMHRTRYRTEQAMLDLPCQ